MFLKSFRDAVLDITSIYPEGAVDDKTGVLYWSGPKRFPKVRAHHCSVRRFKFRACNPRWIGLTCNSPLFVFISRLIWT